jgi:hypothetical protein
MLPEAHVTHHVAGRTRLRVPSRRRNAEYFTRVREELAKRSGFERIETTPVSGSILLHHDLTLEVIEQYGVETELFRITAAPVAESGNVDVKAVGAAGLFGLGLVQVMRGYALGPATTLIGDAVKLMAQKK